MYMVYTCSGLRRNAKRLLIHPLVAVRSCTYFSAYGCQDPSRAE
ncbi:unnamed protein product [Periconia digitata]|uniref:Uncharacterized protein n=1 Tax=Periconia digitata TaxID=1303443 RepID=A0A9W4XLJ6_9PLEO|nr:unnamed protein product [Periconia digitata]